MKFYFRIPLALAILPLIGMLLVIAVIDEATRALFNGDKRK